MGATQLVATAIGAARQSRSQVQVVIRSPEINRGREADILTTCLHRIAAGDAGALASLYDQTRALVFGLALRVLGDPCDAEEVASDVYAHVWRNAKSFDPSRGAVSTWLLMLTRSRAIDRLRSATGRCRGEESEELLVDLPAQGPNPEQVSVLKEKGQRVRAAMEHLNAAQREALELAFFEGLTHSELAERLRQPLGTIKTRIRLAMMKLRGELEVTA